MIIQNGKNKPLNSSSGTVPDMGDALLNYFQPMIFGVVTKTVENFQAVETEVIVNFKGVIQPLTERQLILKPEGQRAWTWFWVHADPSLILEVDSTITYLTKQYRVMSRKDYSLYGYIEYNLVTDYTGSGPEVTTP